MRTLQETVELSSDTVRLDVVQFCKSWKVPSRNITVQIRDHFSDMSRSWLLSIFMVGKFEQRTKILRIPETWRDALKVRYPWLTLLFGLPHYREVPQQIQIYHVCPHIEKPIRTHLTFCTLKPIEAEFERLMEGSA